MQASLEDSGSGLQTRCRTAEKLSSAGQLLVDGACERGPLATLALPDPLTARGEPVVAALASILWTPPLTGYQTLFLEVMKERVERAIQPVPGAVRLVEDPFADAVAVVRPTAQYVQHDQPVRAR